MPYVVLFLVACREETEPEVVRTDPGPEVVDADLDGFPSEASGGRDCDDSDPDVNPNEPDVCNGVDDDCSGEADDDPSAWVDRYTDGDGDGYGDEDAGAIRGCEPTGDLVEQGGDCDDADPNVHPGADEFCNGLDDDCDEDTIEAAERDGRGFASLADAVAGAADGDVVTLCEGTVDVDETVVIDRDLVITSRNGAATAVLDGGRGVGPLISVEDANVELVGLTFRNAQATGDGGAVRATGALVVTDCVFEDNEAGRGGAIFAEEGPLAIVGSTFLRNSAAAGGAIHAQGAPATITSSTFEENVADDVGGAIRADDDLTLTGATFTANRAIDGGAIYATAGDHVADETTRFEDNSVANLGGAVFVRTDVAPVVSWTGGVFRRNHADVAGGAIYAEVIPLAGNSLSVAGVVVDGNDATITGGGVYLYGGPITFTDSVLTDNVGGEGGGSSINATQGYTISVRAVEYRGNRANHGGATDVWEATAVFDDCVFAENEATIGGGAVYVDPQSQMQSNASDWSVPPADNLPDDVQVGQEPNHRAYAFGDDETFSCNGAGPACQ